MITVSCLRRSPPGAAWGQDKLPPGLREGRLAPAQGWEKVMVCHDREPRPWRAAVFCLPLGALALLGALKLGTPAFYHSLVQEDGLLENLQFCFYLAAGLLGLLAAGRLRRLGLAWCAWAALVLGLVMLLAAGEEISWGERILGYGLPQWFAEHNAQHEVSLHNLKPVQSQLSVMYLAGGLALGLGWLPREPLAALPGLNSAWRMRVELFIPPWPLSPYFLPTALLYGYFVVGYWLAVYQGEAQGFARSGLIIWRDQETVELLMSLGCLLWLGRVWLLAAERGHPSRRE